MESSVILKEFVNDCIVLFSWNSLYLVLNWTIGLILENGNIICLFFKLCSPSVLQILHLSLLDPQHFI
jgi:hypothetical protein